MTTIDVLLLATNYSEGVDSVREARRGLIGTLFLKSSWIYEW
jgi:hypothetical protein